MVASKNQSCNRRTPPKILLKEIQLWTKEQTKDFLKILEIEKVNPIFEVIIFTGLRRGEALGLKWDDIDFIKGKIHVRRSLAKIKEKGLFLKDVKTNSSKRQVSISPYLIKRLQEYKRNQDQEKKVLGAAYQDNGMVFCTFDGKLKDP
jgi:integrase